MAKILPDESFRDIFLQGTTSVSYSNFTTNKVNTARQNPWTLIFQFLYKQFQLFPNIWFLFISILEILDSSHGWGTVLVFSLILSINFAKDVYRFYWHYTNDWKVNHRIVSVWNGSDFVEKYWEDLMVGEIILLRDSDIAPADILILGCGNPEGECYVDTFEVLGERNLRVKRSIKSIQAIIISLEMTEAAQYLKKLDEIIKVSHPRKNYKKFKGKINIRSPKPDLISYKNYIMRGEMIVNSSWIFAIVIYTGTECKIYMNTVAKPKLSKFDKKLNIVALWLLFIIALLVLIQMLVGVYKGNQFSNPTSILFINAVLIVHQIVPTELFLCIELIRIIQAWFIQRKYQGIEFKTGSMSEDLGQAEYILVDKTGTLTKNQLSVQVCIIGEEFYWKDQCEETDYLYEGMSPKSGSRLVPPGSSDPRRERFKSEMQTFSQLRLELAHHGLCSEQMKNFALCMVLCNYAYPISESDFTAILEDDRVLVKCAQNLGLNMILRTQSTIVIDVNGVPNTFKILGALPYSPGQKKTMILVSNSNVSGSLLFVKGEKDEMLDLFDLSNEIKFTIEENTLSRSLIGMRTIIFGCKVLSDQKTEEFISDYKNARLSPINKLGRIETVFEKYQNNLNYLGIVGLEDIVAESTQDTVRLLTRAGIKFWILSGDTEESTLRAGVRSAMFEENVRIIRMTDFISESECIEVMINHIQNCIFHDELSSGDLSDASLLDHDNETLNNRERIRSEPLIIGTKDEQKSVHSTSDHNSSKIKEQEHDHHGFRGVMLPLISKSADIKMSISLTKKFNYKAVYFVLSIDSESLEFALKSEESRRYFVCLLFAAQSVFFHSILPHQKRKIVQLLKNCFRFKPTVIAVGDGSDDVGMLQEAHISISLRRSDVTDAENASEIVIDEFAQLRELVLYEGHNCYFRLSKVILGSLYAKFFMAFIQFFYNVVYSYSGINVFGFELELVYELIVTIVPILGIGLFDSQVTVREILEIPQVYCTGIYNTLLTANMLVIHPFMGFLHGVILIFVLCGTVSQIVTSDGYTMSYDLLGFIGYIVMYITFSLNLILRTNSWNVYTIGSHIVTLLLSLLFLLLLTYNEIPSDALNGMTEMIGQSSLAWMIIIFLPLILLMIGIIAKRIINKIYPDDIRKLQELKENNIEPDVDSRLKFYNTRLGDVYVESHSWNQRVIRDTFDINKYTLKFVSKYREKEYQGIQTELNLVFYRVLLFLKACGIGAYVIYRICQEEGDMEKKHYMFLVLISELLFTLISFTKVFRHYMKKLIILNYLFCNIVLVTVWFATVPSSHPVYIIFYMLGFSIFWLEIVICGLIFTMSTWISICFYFYYLDYERDDIILGSFEYMIYFLGIYLASASVGYILDKTKRSEYIMAQNVRVEVDKPLSILNLLLPSSVSRRVKNGDRSFAEDQGIVSVIFCDMNNFDTIVANYSPQELTAFLDEVFGKFDKLCEQSGVSKIETVGKTYMACAGLSIFESEMDPNLTCVSHARRAIEFGFLVIKTAKAIFLKNGEELSFKIGINSGRVVAGVVGNHKPQFSLIGDTVNTSSRMCSTSTEPNRIQISMSTYDLLDENDKQGLKFIPKVVWVKGKGDMNTFMVSLETKADGTNSLENFQTHQRNAAVNQSSPNNNIHTANMRSIGENGSLAQSEVHKRRTSLIDSLDIREARELFDRSNTDTIENVQIFSFRCNESAKEREFRLEAIENKLPMYFVGLYIGIIVFILSIILQIIALIIDKKDSDISFMVISGAEACMFAFISYFLKFYYKKRRFAWIMQATFISGLVLSSTLMSYNDQVYIDIQCIFGMYWILLMTHTSELFFHWILMVSILVLTPWVILVFIFQDSFNKVFIVFAIWYIITAFYTLHHKEKSMRTSYLLISAGKSEIEKTERLLKNMMPPHVYQNLKEEKNITELIKDVTLIYADIVGFTAWSANHAPEEIVRRLSDLFTSFDRMCEEHHVYKVHTIGDCYVAMGYRENNRNPQKECMNMVKFAHSMIEVIEEVNYKYGSELNMRIGMHTGDVIGTMFGTNIVRYDIYGSDVLIANKMESNGEAGKIVVSEDTKILIETYKPGKYQFSFLKEIPLQSLERTIKAFMLLDISGDLDTSLRFH
ncbi:unnamed protein product [Blepharisma stoltei]|uniref:Guanylate cyclase domain-containing protein n=1 Tax=Blepharisma stoltei TaxID=1481888 RepID=A0AAU9JQJ3_9CILI|nr:unnamed protein product [Blepharisma stoltei]